MKNITELNLKLIHLSCLISIFGSLKKSHQSLGLISLIFSNLDSRFPLLVSKWNSFWSGSSNLCRLGWCWLWSSDNLLWSRQFWPLSYRIKFWKQKVKSCGRGWINFPSSTSWIKFALASMIKVVLKWLFWLNFEYFQMMHEEVSSMCQIKTQFRISLDQQPHLLLSVQRNVPALPRHEAILKVVLPQRSAQRALPRHEAVLKVVQHETSCQLISQHCNQNTSLMIRQ